MNTLEILERHVNNSAFALAPDYEINVSFKRLFAQGGDLSEQNQLVSQAWKETSLSPTEIIQLMTPEFQRKNTKWNRHMQKMFIQNIICGCESVIELYDITKPNSNHGESNSKILDGLQRLTACAAFTNNEFGIFEENLYWRDLVDLPFFRAKHLLNLRLYLFKDEFEACQFYIDKNKGITHSEDDLLVAYEFMAKRDQ